MNRRRRLWIVAGAALTVIAAGAATVLVVLPRVVHDRAVAAAGERGVAITIGDVSLAWNGITLRDVAATTADLKDVQITVREIAAPWSRQPSEITARGVELAVRGPFAALRRGEDGALGRGADVAIHVLGAHVVWVEPIGGGSRLEIKDLAGDASHGELHVVGGALTGAAAGVTFGPWRVRHDHTAKETRTRIELDADEHDPSTLVLARDAAGASSLEARVHKGAVGRLGLASPTLDASRDIVAEAEARVAWQSPDDDAPPSPSGAPSHAEGSLAATLHALPLPAAGTGDVKVDLAFAGDPARPIPITRGAFTVGPFEGDVSGTVASRPGGARADLAFKSHPVPCARFASEQAAAALGPLAALAGAVPALTRAVSGNVVVSGTLVVDTADPSATRVAAHPTSDCGLSISLGAP